MARAIPKRRLERHEPRSRRRYGWVFTLAIGAVAAFGAFQLAKHQALSRHRAVAPPPVGLPKTPDYHALLVAPGDPRRILLGTHVGLYESRDGGRTWKIASLEGRDAMNLVRPSAGVLWAAGHHVLARSPDGGRTWEEVHPDGLPGRDVHGFAAAPGNPNTLYAAIAHKGLYRSGDGGRTFTLVSKQVGPNVFGLAVTPAGRIFAADPRRGVLASDRGGATWKLALGIPVVAVAVNPARPETILAAGAGIFLSRDGGQHFRRVLSLQRGAGPVAWAPSRPRTAYAVGFDRTLYRTDDGGASWRPVR